MEEPNIDPEINEDGSNFAEEGNSDDPTVSENVDAESETPDTEPPATKKVKYMTKAYYTGFNLSQRGEDAHMNELRVRISFKELVSIATYGHLGKDNCYTLPGFLDLLPPLPRVQHTIIIVLSGMSYEKLRHCQFIRETLDCELGLFDIGKMCETVSFTASLISNTQQLIKVYGSTLLAELKTRSASDGMDTLYTIVDSDKEESSDPPGEVVNRSSLSLSLEEQLAFNFPLPARSRRGILLQELYEKPQKSSPMVAIDTEGGVEPTRVAVCGEDGKKILDYIVKSDLSTEYLQGRFNKDNKDYLAERLSDQKTMPEIRRELRKVIGPDTYVIGHDVGNDLRNLQIQHPHIIETTVLYNLTGIRGRKDSLDDLCKKFATKENPNRLPLQDARAAMALVKEKLKHGLLHGNEFLKTSGTNVPPAGKSVMIGKNSMLEEIIKNAKDLCKSDEVENINLVQAERPEDVFDHVQKNINQKFIFAKINKIVKEVEYVDSVVKEIWRIAPLYTVVNIVNDNVRNSTAHLGIKTCTPDC